MCRIQSQKSVAVETIVPRARPRERDMSVASMRASVSDRIWMRLQRRRGFVVPAIRAAYQQPGYSDVEGRVVAYGH